MGKKRHTPTPGNDAVACLVRARETSVSKAG